MFKRKVKFWYWQTLIVLFFCVFLFSVARFFMKIVMMNENKSDNSTFGKKEKKKKAEPLFV